MEQTNRINGNVKQFESKLGFLNPSTTFIANAAFAGLAFILFILNNCCAITTESAGEEMVSNALTALLTDGLAGAGGGFPKMTSVLFQGIGGIIAFLALLGLVAGTIIIPAKRHRLSVFLNFIVSSFMLLSAFAFIRWNIVTIIMIFIVILPWMALTLIKRDDEVKL